MFEIKPQENLNLEVNIFELTRQILTNIKFVAYKDRLRIESETATARAGKDICTSILGALTPRLLLSGLFIQYFEVDRGDFWGSFASLSAAEKNTCFFLIFGPWTSKTPGFDLKIGFCIKFPPWGRVLRSQFCNSDPKIQKKSN